MPRFGLAARMDWRAEHRGGRFHSVRRRGRDLVQPCRDAHGKGAQRLCGPAVRADDYREHEVSLPRRDLCKGTEAARTEQFTKWNPISRIGLAKDKDAGEMIFIDADASTAIAKFDFNHLNADALRLS